MYNRKDHYYKKAKEEGFASRAVYKFEQIQQKYKVLGKGDVVVDLGCAPGGWMQILARNIGSAGFVVGIDILPIKISLPPNSRFISADINDDDIAEKIMALLPNKDGKKFPADVVVSDMAPNTSGVAFKDAYLSYELNVMALSAAFRLLKDGGNFVCKQFQGEEVNTLRVLLRKAFTKVEFFTPPATREASKEFYFVAKGLRDRTIELF